MTGHEQIIARRRLEARGLVQGVGFRPHVYRLARRLDLGGLVYNHSTGVTIEVEGPADALAAFESALRGELPAPARLDSLVTQPLTPTGTRVFTIETSESHDGDVALVLADLAVCADCRRELLDPADRRFGHAFCNCTHCGPRFTIVAELPYDRAATTMRGFAMCERCRAEYESPLDRRFHAQPIACPDCGPTLRLISPAGEPLPGEPIAAAAELLRGGRIVAVKGLGGYHLACDATNSAAVARLRERKHREAKPLAVMVADLAAAATIAELSAAEAELLAGPAAPIVLLTARDGAGLAEDLAPGMRTVGVMLAYTPLHGLLLAEAGRPLVMTSGNRTDEPIAYLDDDALARLGDIADALLMHDRPIERRCDDSVVRLHAGRPLPLRRSRGEAPKPLLLAEAARGVILAVGGHQKNTFCLTRGHEAFLSHHLGDLESDLALAAFESGIADFERLFRLRPEVLAHDLHPDYLATQYALARAERDGLELVGVQHHHAHLVSCLVDAARDEPAIGVTFDGTGWGPDGTIWGGELLVGDRHGYRRAARLRPFVLPGGEAAVRQGWRVALALAAEADVFIDPDPLGADPEQAAFVIDMIERGIRCVPTSSAGRLFDGFAALLGIATDSRYEGEAAVRLEAAAAPASCGALPFDLAGDGELVELDWRPAVAEATDALARGTDPAALARRFHEGLAEGTAAACARIRRDTGCNLVALTGGCLQNVLLAERLELTLSQRGFQILRHQRVPPSDGGLSLGQAAIAGAAWRD